MKGFCRVSESRLFFLHHKTPLHAPHPPSHPIWIKVSLSKVKVKPQSSWKSEFLSKLRPNLPTIPRNRLLLCLKLAVYVCVLWRLPAKTHFPYEVIFLSTPPLFFLDMLGGECLQCDRPPRVSTSFSSRLLQPLTVPRRSLQELQPFSRVSHTHAPQSVLWDPDPNQQPQTIEHMLTRWSRSKANSSYLLSHSCTLD